nr:CP52k-like protein 12 [Membranobalanus longirostrum]
MYGPVLFAVLIAGVCSGTGDNRAPGAGDHTPGNSDSSGTGEVYDVDDVYWLKKSLDGFPPLRHYNASLEGLKKEIMRKGVYPVDFYSHISAYNQDTVLEPYTSLAAKYNATLHDEIQLAVVCYFVLVTTVDKYRKFPMDTVEEVFNHALPPKTYNIFYVQEFLKEFLNHVRVPRFS